MKKLNPIIPNFNSREELHDRIWWAMCDSKLDYPDPLRSVVKLPNSFVYVRKYGLFTLGFDACHPEILTLFLAWELGYYNTVDLLDHEDDSIDINFAFAGYETTADYYLENYEGTCYRSSVGKGKIYCGDLKMLNSFEREFFYPHLEKL